MAEAAQGEPGARLERLIARCRESASGLDRSQLQDLSAELEDLRAAFAARAANLERDRAAAEAARAMAAELFDRAPVGYLIIDRDGVIVRANATIAGMLRTAVGALVGQRFDVLLVPDARLTMGERLSALFRDAGGGSFESCLQRRSGSALRVQLEGRLVRAEPDGAGRRLLLAISDSEAQHWAREEIRAREEHLDVTLDSIGDAVLTTDAQGRITRLNRVAQQLTGWDEGAASGRPLTEVFRIVQAHSRTPAADPVARVLATGRIVGLANHTLLIARDGQEYQIADSAAPICDDAGAIRGVVLVFRDVTEEYALQEGVARNERLLRETLDSLGEAFMALDRELVVTWYNPAAERMLGRPAGEVVGRQLFDAFPEARGSVFEERYRRALATGEPDSFEVYFDHPPFANWYEVRVHPREAGIAVMFQVTTQRRCAAEDLRRQRDFSRTVLETVASLVVVLDRHGRIVSFNPACERVTGYHEDEVRGRLFYEFLVPPEQVAGVRAVFADLEHKAMPNEHENHWLTRDGELRLISWTNAVIRDEQGAVAYIMGTGLDITRQRRAEEDLRRSEQRFRGLFAASPMGIALVDVHTQRVIEANAAFCAIVGCAVADAAGLAVADFTDPAEWEQERSLVEEVLAARRSSYTMRKRYRRADGAERLVELTGSVMQGPEDQTIAVAMVQDISERDALEARLRQAQKLEAVGQLAGGIAHDFNNLLQAIVSHAALAERGEVAAERARHHQGIFAAADRARDMIQRILTFSRRSDRRVEPVRLGRVVGEALELMRGGVPATLQFQARIGAPDLIVDGDASELHQVVMNLCANAVQAMHERGTVRVEFDVATIAQSVVLRAGRLDPGTYARLSVSDTGTGIRPQDLERIFDPFFTTKPAGEGTGLGLATIHGIVREAGGAIEVETAVGVGTTIHCYLPASTTQPAEAGRAQLAAPVDLTGLTVVVLDDEPMLVELAGLVLEDAGAQVHGFTDPAAALAQLLREPTRYHALLSDQTMPGLTGIELAQRMRDAQIGIPVAICSGYAREVHAVDLDRLVLRYLKKPIDPAELVRQVAQMVGR